MMRSPHAKRWLAPVLLVVMGAFYSGAVPAAAPAAKPDASSRESSQRFVDGIAAVVNKQVITLHQLRTEAEAARKELERQRIPVPPQDALQRQVLQRMITDELERQEAERLGIRVTDEHLDRALETIAQRNRITTAKLRQEIERSGINWSDYLKTLRQDVRSDMLRQRAVDNTITISDAEVDAFLKTQGQRTANPQPSSAPVPAAQQNRPQILGLAQILVVVPEGAPAARVQELRKNAEGLLARVRSGADFAGVAAASSDGPEALEGGVLGTRPIEGWPDLFVKATQDLQAGQVSGIVQSGNGFHILKVLTRGERGGQPASAPAHAPPPTLAQPALPEQGPMMVTQTHARHILIKTSKVMSDEKAQARMAQLRERLAHGESFETLAKRYSEDATAPQGGDLGWLTPGETVPAFEQAMNELEVNQISQPVKSQFGWHLIQVLERRTKNMENEFRRMQARQILFEQRVGPAFEDWLGQLRGQAYIDNRLDPESSSRRR
ncbi:MAG: peptidylprolyl isomerase [Alcaligenaceae bacterium]|nr:peptidylprolyl isomerase [Alcaligenaceae bacterium]